MSSRPDPERLEQLDEDIHELKNRLEEVSGDDPDVRRFGEDGDDEGEDEEGVDDAATPPA